MKPILIDGTTLSRHTDGLTQYAYSVILELCKFTTLHYVLIVRAGMIPEAYESELLKYKNMVTVETVSIKPIGLIRDLQFLWWWKKNKQRFDGFYEPSTQYPLGLKGGLYTVHDILYEEFPEKLGKYSFLKKCYLHHVVHRGVIKADNIVAVSEFTKSEIIKYHHVKRYAEKIHVVYEGYEHLEKTLPNSAQSFNLNFDTPYFLYVGSSRGHKNLHNLFLAFSDIKNNWLLIVVGTMARLSETDKQLVAQINKEKDKIVFTDWVEEETLYRIMSRASALVFPSKSEGFGIPILEAFYFNIPLLCSDIPVFREVAGNACLSFNPFDIKDISQCLDTFVLLPDEEKADLLKRQREQLKKYSWQKTAKQIYSLLTSNIKDGTAK